MQPSGPFFNIMRLQISKLAGVALLIAAMTTGCSDDSPQAGESGRSTITFNVTTSEMSTRSGAASGSVLTSVAMSGGDRSLWLVPEVTDGVDRNPEDLKVTRSTLTDNTSIDSFGVFSRRTDSESDAADYMFNVDVERSTSWSPVAEYHWPGDGQLHFTAYSPYVSEGDADGIVSLPGKDDAPSIGFKVPADVAGQFDFLVAESTDAGSSPCNLTFNHALSAIRFAAGAELAPCTVKTITVSNVYDSATVSLETAEWSGLSGNASYMVEVNKTLEATEGSQYVEPGMAITDGGQTLLLLPQTLGTDALVEMVIESNGKEYSLKGSISGQEWQSGKTYTYKLSGNPDSDSLILDVTGDFHSPYYGTTIPFTVNSKLSKGGSISDIDWKAEFVDDKGNVIDEPSWILEFPLTGTGKADYTLSTDMDDLIFHQISSVSKSLQEAQNINESSGFTPYNLGSSSGVATVENTANTYVISAPGKYSIPLVYGNAIKDGADNKKAYTYSSSSRNTLHNFTNHLGNAITSPYIYENTGCQPADAVLVWEDELRLVREVSLSSDKKSLTFNIPQNTIREGNAIVGVRDADGKIIWSWQLWFTSLKPSESRRDFTLDGKSYGLLTENLGYVGGGDEVEFPEASVKVRFTQVNVPDGLEPLSKTITIEQASTTLTTPECNTFYQYGRKDPMMSSIKQWYNPDHQEKQVLPMKQYAEISDLLSWEIQNPDVMVQSGHSTGGTTSSDTPALSYTNLWNSQNSTSNFEKSIYDPSPVGYRAPYGNVFLAIYNHIKNVDVADGAFSLNLNDGGAPLVFHPLGYRASSNGGLDGVGDRATLWCARMASTRREAMSLIINEDGLQHPTNPVFHAFSLRPIAE